jgi:hypothetical protein
MLSFAFGWKVGGTLGLDSMADGGSMWERATLWKMEDGRRKTEEGQKSLVVGDYEHMREYMYRFTGGAPSASMFLSAGHPSQMIHGSRAPFGRSRYLAVPTRRSLDFPFHSN